MSAPDDVISVVPTEFDETDLSQSSNWTEAHENENSTGPAGYVDAARLIAEVGLRLLGKDPALVDRILLGASAREFEVHSVEDFGLLCLRLSPQLADTTRANARRVRNAPAVGDGSDEIPF
jgi:hypothetical protein